MQFNISFKSKFKINGKEYGSLDEMPEATRETFKKAMAMRGDLGSRISSASKPGKIVFNSVEYESPEAMPQDVRELYQKVLKAAGTGEATAGMNLARLSVGLNLESGTRDAIRPNSMPPPAKAEPSFSARTLIFSVLLGAVLLAIYYFWQNK